MKFERGYRIKSNRTKPFEHDDFEILSTFTSEQLNGYIVINLYTNRITAFEQKYFEKNHKLSNKQKDDALYILFKDRYNNVKNQVLSKVNQPVFDEWEVRN